MLKFLKVSYQKKNNKKIMFLLPVLKLRYHIYLLLQKVQTRAAANILIIECLADCYMLNIFSINQSFCLKMSDNSEKISIIISKSSKLHHNSFQTACLNQPTISLNLKAFSSLHCHICRMRKPYLLEK